MSFLKRLLGKTPKQERLSLTAEPTDLSQQPQPPAGAQLQREEHCEACRVAPIQQIVESEEPTQPYRLCSQCAERLLAHALRPSEWFNLAAMHGPYKHLLHDDFYPEDGVAEQSMEEVVDPEHFPAPTLAKVGDDLGRLLDYTMTRHALEPDVVEALKCFSHERVLVSLNARVTAYHNVDIEARAYEICGKAVLEAAGEWLRQRWSLYRPEILAPLAEATARCLPPDEGFQRVVQALAALDEKELRDQCMVLAWFHTEKTLDWLEQHAASMSPYSDGWGRLAATSEFSWERASAWLDKGEPFSLIALDALWRYGMWIDGEDAPRRWNLAPLEVMQNRLESFDGASDTQG